MSKIYTSEYDASTGQWVAVAKTGQENARGKSIKSNLGAKLASASVALSASVAILSSGSAMADDSAPQRELLTDISEQDAVQSNDSVNGVTIVDGTAKGNLPGVQMFGAQLLGAAPTGGSVLYDTSASDSISLLGTAGTRITNLTAGTLSAVSKDAVNGSQLFSTNQNVSSLQTSIAQINSNGALGSLVAVKASVWGPASAAGFASSAFGAGASASGDYGLAIGAGSQASGFSSTAIGSSATATGGTAVALGQYSKASGEVASALGFKATASGGASVAIGPSAAASGYTSVALGYVSVADRDKTVSIGQPGFTRQLVNMAAGTQANDAVNFGQLQAAGLKVDTSGVATNSFVAYDDKTKSQITLGNTKISGVAAGDVSASSTDAVNGSQLFSMQRNVTVSALSADLSGLANALASGHNAVAIGPGSYAGDNSVALGIGSQAGTMMADLATSVGYRAGATGAFSTALGANASATADGSTALGMGSAAIATNSVALGASSNATRDNTVSVGSAGNERQIVNVAAGTQDTDAVNVAQLHAAGLVIDSNGAISNSFVAYDDASRDTATLGGTSGTAIGNVRAMPIASDSGYAASGSQLFATGTSLAAALGGGASLDMNGRILAPTFTVGGNEVHDVGSAVDYLDRTATRNSADIAELKGAIVNAGASPGSGASVSGDSVAYDTSERDKLTLGGTTEGVSPVQLSNVLAGDLSSSSTDAVNGAQLGATNERVSATESAVAGYKAAGLEFVAINTSSAGAAKPVAGGNDSIAIGANAVASADNSIALGANSIASDANTVSVGSSGNERRISNIATGVNATDAVNVAQMSQLRTDMDASIRSVQRQAFGGIAAAMAMPNLAPSAPGKVVLAAGIGNYKGYSAIAAAATYRSPNGKWLANGGISVTPSGGTGIRAQVGYEF